MAPESKAKKRARQAAESRWEKHEDGVSPAVIKQNIKRLEEYKRKQGQPFTREEAICLLTCYYRYLDENPHHNWAVRQTVDHLPFSRASVTSAVESWKSHGEIRVASRRGPTGGGLTEDVKRQLARCVEQLNMEGNVTFSKLQEMLRTPSSASASAGAASGDDPDHGRMQVSVSCSTIRNWLQIMGYSRVKGEKGFIFTTHEATT